MADSITTRVKVIAEVPVELRDEIDTLGAKVDLKMSQIVREALERFLPLLRQRAVERELATAMPETATAQV